MRESLPVIRSAGRIITKSQDIALGLSPSEAIVAATARPAQLLGIQDMGTLAAGKSADFIVLDGNPLDDIRNTRKIASVYLDGKRLDREALLAAWKKSAM